MKVFRILDRFLLSFFGFLRCIAYGFIAACRRLTAERFELGIGRVLHLDPVPMVRARSFLRRALEHDLFRAGRFAHGRLPA